MGLRVKVSDLKTNNDFFIRSKLDEDAIQRYIELYQSGKEKAIKVQSKTYIIIDGWHRVEAARRLGLKSLLAEVIDASEIDIRTLAFKYNKSHGIPLNREERNRLIAELYFKDGKTQRQIADLMGLSRQRVDQILASQGTSNANNDVDKRRELKLEDYPVIARLILGGEKQSDVAKKFGVSQGRISQVWAEFRDEIYKLYTEEKLLKREVAEKVNLTLDKVDKILQGYGDPLNFGLMVTTWWSAFGLDARFGKEHPSNLPADLIRNILALYSKQGNVILDPAAGGGVVIDVAEDMVNRKCVAYDLIPKRDDIKTHNLLVEAPSEPKDPDLIFIDFPYGPIKEYSEAHSSDLANMAPSQFLEALSKIFRYWNAGTLVVLMSSYRGKEGFIDLPFETEKRMIEAGWKIVEHIVNEHGRQVASETGYWLDKARKERWLLRKHIHILVGKK